MSLCNSVNAFTAGLFPRFLQVKDIRAVSLLRKLARDNVAAGVQVCFHDTLR